MAIEVILYPKPIVQLLDEGEEVVKRNKKWETIVPLLEEAKKLHQYSLERFKILKPSWETSSALEPAVKEIEKEFSNQVLILDEIGQSERNLGILANNLVLLEESSYRLSVLSRFAVDTFYAKKPISPIGAVNDTLRIGFRVIEEDLPPEYLRDRIAPLYNLQNSMNIDMPFLKLKLGEDHEAVKGVEAGFSALQEGIGGLYTYLFETQNKTDLEMTLKILKVAGDTLHFWLGQIDASLPDSFKVLEERYREYFSLLLEQLKKDPSYQKSTGEFIKFLVTMEENGLKNVSADRENIFLTMADKEEVFNRLEDFTKRQIETLNSMQFLSSLPENAGLEKVLELDQQYRQISTEKDTFWRETLTRTMPPAGLEKAENFMYLYAMTKAVYTVSLPKKVFRDKLKVFFEFQNSFIEALEERQAQSPEKKEEASNLLEALQKQLSCVEKCWQFDTPEEKDLLVEAAWLIGETTLEIIRLQSEMAEKEDQENISVCLCGAVNPKGTAKCQNCGFTVPDAQEEEELTLDIREDIGGTVLTYCEDNNLKTIENTVNALEKEQITREEAEEIFRTFLQRVEFVDEQLKTQVKAVVDKVKDPKLTSTQQKFLSVTAKFKETLNNILTDFSCKSVYLLKEGLDELKGINQELFVLRDELEPLAAKK